MNRLARIGMSIAKVLYGRGIARFPFLVWFWEFFCSRIARVDTMCVGVRGMRLWIDPVDMGCGIGILMEKERFDEPLVRLFERMVKEGMTVADVGANIGFFSVLFSRLVGGQGRVYAFEPNPDNYELLARNLRENNSANAVPVAKALSDASGQGKLFLYPQRRAGSARGSIVCGNKGWQCVDTPVITLDDFIADAGGRLDLVKMDVEGAEEKVIGGMRRTLSANPECAIVMEFVPHLLMKAGTSPSLFIDEVIGAGFIVSPVENGALRPFMRGEQAVERCGNNGGIDIVCVRQRSGIRNIVT